MSRRGAVIRLGLAFLAGLVFPALVFLLVGVAGLFPVAATEAPSGLETRVARLFVQRSLPPEVEQAWKAPPQ